MYSARVQVLKSKKKGYGKTIGCFGTIIKNSEHGINIGILLDNFHNENSKSGLFWYDNSEIKIIKDEEKFNMPILEGYKNVAIIEDQYKRDRYFALYDSNIEAGNFVLVTGSRSGTVLKIKEVLSIDAIDSKFLECLTEEVICKVDMSDYEKRLANRDKVKQIKSQLINKRKEIEARKNDDYYAEIDSDYAELLAELRLLSK